MHAIKALHKEIRPKALYLYNQNKIINFLHRDMVNSSVLDTYFRGSDTESFDKEKFERKALHYENYIDNDIQVYYLNEPEELYRVDDPNGHSVLYCINTDSYWNI